MAIHPSIGTIGQESRALDCQDLGEEASFLQEVYPQPEIGTTPWFQVIFSVYLVACESEKVVVACLFSFQPHYCT